MEFTEKDMKRIALTLLVLVLAVLVFFTLKPVLFAIIGGLILAYIFFPVYKWIEKRVKYKSLAAALVSVIVLIIIFLPLWFLAPVMMERIFEVFSRRSWEILILCLVSISFTGDTKKKGIEIDFASFRLLRVQKKTIYKLKK